MPKTNPQENQGAIVPAVRDEISNIDEQIKLSTDEANQLSTELREQVEEVATRYARMPSQVLVGISGGVIGAVAGVPVAVFIAEGALVISGPLGLALGAASFILLFRLRNSLLDRENKSDKLKIIVSDFKIKAQTLKEQIDQTDKFFLENKDKIDRDDSLLIRRLKSQERLWNSYDNLIEELDKTFRNLEQDNSWLTDKSKEDGNEDYQNFTEKLGNGIKLDMIAIPGGKFMMGSPEGEGDDSEKPQHEVTVQPFFMGKYPITQAQYQQVMSDNPSNFKGNDRPVECVSWDDAVEFCQRLSKQKGKKYRLPSEAEWEYACRAKTSTAYYFGETITDRQANFEGNVDQTTSVGQYPPNAFGLYDMHGNVWEWCQDKWHANYQGAPNDCNAWVSGTSNNYVLRGGSWDYVPSLCRSAYRFDLTRGLRLGGIGFRVVCVAPRTT